MGIIFQEVRIKTPIIAKLAPTKPPRFSVSMIKYAMVIARVEAKTRFRICPLKVVTTKKGIAMTAKGGRS
jgi:hypothetical protein